MATKLNLILWYSASLLASLWVGYNLGSFESSLPSHKLHSPPSIGSCTNSAIELIKPNKLEAETINKLNLICYNTILDQYNLNDFEVRKLKYLHQSYADRVVLWMIFLITISGVILAALQMAASFQLAATGREMFTQSQELLHENGKLIIKSSVTGLFILVISFAFLTLFIYKIHPLNEHKIGKEAPAPKNMPNSANELGKLKRFVAPKKNDEPGFGDKASPDNSVTSP